MLLRNLQSYERKIYIINFVVDLWSFMWKINSLNKQLQCAMQTRLFHSSASKQLFQWAANKSYINNNVFNDIIDHN